MSLQQLIEACKKNNVKAQSDLYKLFSSKVFGVCLKYSRNYTEAQDHLQDAFVTAFSKISQYKHKGSFEGWLKRIAINTALQQYRKTKSVFEVVDDNIKDDTEIDIDHDNVSLDFLLQIIQQLPDRYRLVFNLYVLDDYSHKDIAQMLDISPGTSKSNLARARQILKTKIETYKTQQKVRTIS